MANKKAAIITFRTTNEVRAELEYRADKYGWSVSQYVENLITNQITEELDDAEDYAEEIIKKIENNEIKNITELAQWAITNNCLTEINITVDLWKAILEEHKPAIAEVTKK